MASKTRFSSQFDARNGIKLAHFSGICRAKLSLATPHQPDMAFDGAHRIESLRDIIQHLPDERAAFGLSGADISIAFKARGSSCAGRLSRVSGPDWRLGSGRLRHDLPMARRQTQRGDSICSRFPSFCAGLDDLGQNASSAWYRYRNAILYQLLRLSTPQRTSQRIPLIPLEESGRRFVGDRLLIYSAHFRLAPDEDPRPDASHRRFDWGRPHGSPS